MVQSFGNALEPAPGHVPAPTEFDPVYGLPRWRVEEWLARNPHLRPQYEAEARQRQALLARRRDAGGERAVFGGRPRQVFS